MNQKLSELVNIVRKERILKESWGLYEDGSIIGEYESEETADQEKEKFSKRHPGHDYEVIEIPGGTESVRKESKKLTDAEFKLAIEHGKLDQLARGMFHIMTMDDLTDSELKQLKKAYEMNLSKSVRKEKIFKEDAVEELAFELFGKAYKTLNTSQQQAVRAALNKRVHTGESVRKEGKIDVAVGDVKGFKDPNGKERTGKVIRIRQWDATFESDGEEFTIPYKDIEGYEESVRFKENADDATGPFKTREEAEKEQDRQHELGGRSASVEEENGEFWVYIWYAGSAVFGRLKEKYIKESSVQLASAGEFTLEWDKREGNQYVIKDKDGRDISTHPDEGAARKAFADFVKRKGLSIQESFKEQAASSVWDTLSADQRKPILKDAGINKPDFTDTKWGDLPDYVQNRVEDVFTRKLRGQKYESLKEQAALKTVVHGGVTYKIFQDGRWFFTRSGNTQYDLNVTSIEEAEEKMNGLIDRGEIEPMKEQVEVPQWQQQMVRFAKGYLADGKSRDEAKEIIKDKFMTTDEVAEQVLAFAETKEENFKMEESVKIRTGSMFAEKQDPRTQFEKKRFKEEIAPGEWFVLTDGSSGEVQSIDGDVVTVKMSDDGSIKKMSKADYLKLVKESLKEQIPATSPTGEIVALDELARTLFGKEFSELTEEEKEQVQSAHSGEAKGESLKEAMWKIKFGPNDQDFDMQDAETVEEARKKFFAGRTPGSVTILSITRQEGFKRLREKYLKEQAVSLPGFMTEEELRVIVDSPTASEFEKSAAKSELKRRGKESFKEKEEFAWKVDFNDGSSRTIFAATDQEVGEQLTPEEMEDVKQITKFESYNRLREKYLKEQEAPAEEEEETEPEESYRERLGKLKESVQKASSPDDVHAGVNHIYKLYDDGEIDAKTALAKMKEALKEAYTKEDDLNDRAQAEFGKEFDELDNAEKQLILDAWKLTNPEPTGEEKLKR